MAPKRMAFSQMLVEAWIVLVSGVEAQALRTVLAWAAAAARIVAEEVGCWPQIRAYQPDPRHISGVRCGRGGHSLPRTNPECFGGDLSQVWAARGDLVGMYFPRFALECSFNFCV